MASERASQSANRRALPTYYAVLLKLLAARAVGWLPADRGLRLPLSRIESGALFREAGIRNVLDGVGFGWYLADWDRSLEIALWDVVNRVCQYDLPPAGGDLFKNLYLQLFSKESRHPQGEYYTPDWLAEKLLRDTIGARLGDPTLRVLDPACGSGTFLVLLIERIKRRAAGSDALELILRNVVGFDRNPLAVLAARTNYLLTLGECFSGRAEEIEIPVYAADALQHAPPPELFDFVVGNPPWINWEHLAEEDRRATRPLWEHYALFPKRAKAIDRILGGAKYDLSMLLTYVAADRYLRPNGRLGFVVPQTLFKSAAAGHGFRRFQLPDGTPLAPVSVNDLVQLKPFGAANRTATLVLQKGRAVRYPVVYRYHNRSDGTHYDWRARPVSAADPAGPWMTAPPAALAALRRIVGTSGYRAREGANTGGANGVFWVDAIAEAAGERMRIRNVTDSARQKVEATEALVESGLLFPLLRGQNVARWRAIPCQSLLLTHQPGMKLRAIPEPEMAQSFPRALAYLQRFERMLRARPAFRRYFRADGPFYSLFNIGDYTFAPWKVVWREQAQSFTAAAIGPVNGRVVIPDHKLMLVSVSSEREAHYLCGVLNSLPVRAAVAAYAIEIQIATHVLEHLRVPRFDRTSLLHRQLATAARRAHAAVQADDRKRQAEAEAAIDAGAAALWGLSANQMTGMRAFLREAGLAP